MAYGDVNYTFIAGGSTATSAATSHRLLGTYGGLSTLNGAEAVVLHVSASNSPAFVHPSAPVLNAGGVYIAPSGVVQLLPVAAASVNAAEFRRVLAENVVMYWSLWSRNP